MQFWGKAIGYGFLVWLTPFIVAFLVYPIHESARPLFESIMAVAVSTTAIIWGLFYLKHVTENSVREGILLGILWLIISILIDAPLMLIGGPMKMSFGDYMADIGVTYICTPIITWGLGMAYSRSDKKNNIPEQEMK